MLCFQNFVHLWPAHHKVLPVNVTVFAKQSDLALTLLPTFKKANTYIRETQIYFCPKLCVLTVIVNAFSFSTRASDMFFQSECNVFSAQ